MHKNSQDKINSELAIITPHLILAAFKLSAVVFYVEMRTVLWLLEVIVSTVLLVQLAGKSALLTSWN